MTRTSAELILLTVGPLTVRAADGTDRTPKGQRAKGLLALLALAPKCQRSRAWLQAKLWSSRAPKQAADSLRQALVEVRKSFGSARSCLLTKGTMVALDLRRVEIHQRPAIDATGSGLTDEVILFEDLDIEDEAFDDWLDQQRREFDRKNELHVPERTETPLEVLLPAKCTSSELQLIIQPASKFATTGKEVMADVLLDNIARSVTELGHVDVIDLRGGESPDRRPPASEACAVTVRSAIVDDADGLTCRISLTSSDTNRLHATAVVHPKTCALDDEEATVLRELNQFVERICSQFSADGEARDRQVAARLCRQGIERLFRLRKEDLQAADRLFARAYELEDRGIYLAWRAYLRTFMMVEFIPSDRQALAEEALALSHRALELDPLNSYVASFAAHVQMIARRSNVTAFEFAERAVKLNPANPIGLASLGIAECHLNRPGPGYARTLRAREVAGVTPYRFFITAQASIAGSMANDIDGAIHLAEVCHGLAPASKPPMRFLSALYLLRDRYADSQKMVDLLRVTEPNFSYDLLRDSSYPASSLHRSGLLTKLPQRQI